MLRDQIKELLSESDYPSVTITLPTHRTAPDNEKDRIRLKNLADDARDLINAELRGRDAAPVLALLESAIGSVNPQHLLDGLAVLVNRNRSEVFVLPYPMAESVTVDSTFALRQLVRASNRMTHYRIIALSEKATTLFDCVADALVEVKTHGFPLRHDAPGGELRLGGGAGVNSSAQRDEFHRLFFKKIAEAYHAVELETGEKLPCVVLGIGNFLSFFREAAGDKIDILATVEGNYDHTNTTAIAKKVWPVVQEKMTEVRAQRLADMKANGTPQNTASGIEDAWRATHEGRGAYLFVEESYSVPGKADETGLQLTLLEDGSGPDAMEDAVDDLIEAVIARGGRVQFVNDGELAQYQRIALSLRY